jgi:protein-S-isoprenylcysteine O-methyltransferase Ste14
VELEQRVKALEREVEILKGEIRGTLLDVQESLAEKPASPSRWRKRAWVLALLNLLLSIVLFTNIRFYTPEPAPGGGSLLDSWLQAFWVALAFVWLLLQMYPLALLLDQEEPRARDAAWRNAGALFRSNPGLTLALTLVILVVAVVSVLFPSLWLVLTVALLAVVCFNAAGPLLRLCRERMR